MKINIVIIGCIICALFNQAFAQDLLRLEQYEIGDTSLGTNTIIEEDELQKKYLTGNHDKGQILIPVNIGMNSEIEMEAYIYNQHISLFLLSEEQQIKFYIYSSLTNLTGNAIESNSKDASKAWIYSYNKIRIVLVNGEIKIYINDVFSQKAKLVNPNLVFTNIKLIDIDNRYNKIFKLIAHNTINQSSVSTATTDSYVMPTCTNNSNPITISPNLDIYIPSAQYRDLTNEIKDIWIKLHFDSLSNESLSWKLTDYGIN